MAMIHGGVSEWYCGSQQAHERVVSYRVTVIRMSACRSEPHRASFLRRVLFAILGSY